MRILVVGAGATGGYFGARLAEAGRDVTFLVRAGRADQLKRSGLQIKSPHGDLALRPKLVTAGALDRPFDAVLLAVKAFALEGAYGERDGTMSERVRALDAQLQNAGFKAQASDTILLRMWEKWVLLATVGGVTCLMRGTVGEVEAAPGGTAFALALLDECVAVATAAGFTPREPFVKTAKGMITARGSSFASSMFRDMSAGAPIEADQIIGDLLARARRHGVGTPLLAVANAHLAVYQNRVRPAPLSAAAS